MDIDLTDKVRDFLAQENLNYTENSVSFILGCPICAKRKLYIRKKDGLFRCWKCKETDRFSGKVQWALHRLTQIPVQAILSRLGLGPDLVEHQSYLEVDFLDHWEEPEEDLQEWGMAPQVPPEDYRDLDDPKSKAGLEYLQGRGIELTLAQHYGIKYSSYEGRILFPVIYQGVLWGWQTRSILKTAKIPKLTSHLKKGRLVMFADHMIAGKPVIVTEGPVDALKCFLAAPAVCTMGKGVSQAQIEMIERAKPSAVYLGLDPDAATESDALVGKFSVPVYQIEIPKHREDLGDCSLEEVRSAFEQAKRVTAANLSIYLGF